ncbi:hypothetical protein WME73_31125 [Sorangium sp. So ce302]|uniref:hypothetical protein n=1 Tax=Sorangium sp. So ce302 TaxID=3133297 RepID=UPI003F60B9DF
MGARGTTGLGLRFTLVALGCAGCNALLGLEDGILVEEGCAPLSTIACYSGPPATEGVGACQTGLMRCNAAGDGYGPCEGEVTPAPERCGNAADDDCDGAIDEADGDGGRPEDPAADGGSAVCACAPGTVEPCPYGGPPGTVGVGACRAGRRTCGLDSRWGACAGEVTPRVEDCSTPADDDCNGGWDCGAVLPGGPLGALLGGAGQERARALAAGPGGSAILGGEFAGSLDLGAGQFATGAEQDIFVARLDPGGTVAWIRRFVTEGRGALQALAVDLDGHVAITGELVGKMNDVGLTADAPLGFVIKLDDLGEPQWSAMILGRPQDIAASARGEFVVVSTLMDPGGTDVAVAKLDTSGELLWRREFRGAGNQEPTGVAVDPRGDVVMTGTFDGELQLGDDAPRLLSKGMSDVFLAKLDEGGEHVASLAFGDGRLQRGGDIEIGPGGEIALSGTFDGILDLGGGELFSEGMSAFVAELGPAREHRFSRAYPAERPPRLALEADGGLVLAGDVDGPTDLGGGPLDGAGGGGDIVVARFDAGGRHVWSKRLGPGAGSSGGRRSAAGVASFVERGHALLAGTVEGSVDLDGATAQSTAADILVVRLSP